MSTTSSKPMRATRSAWGLVLAVMLARIAFGYQMQTVASLGPELVSAFQIDFAALGTLMGAYMLAGVAVAIPSGFIARRFGAHRVLAWGVLLMAAGSVLAAVADTPSGIGVGRGVSGAGAVAMTVMQGKLISDRFAGAGFSRVMGLTVGAFPIGIGLAQLTQVRLAAAFGLGAPFMAGAALALFAWLLFVLSWNVVPGTSPPGGSRTVAWPSRRENILVVLASLVWTAYNAAYFNFLAFMPSYLASRGHPALVADLVMTIATWGNLPAILLGSALAIHFGRLAVFLVGTTVCAISVAGPVLFDVPLLWGLLFGTVAAIHGGLIVEIGTLSAQPENREVGMGLFYTTYYIGGSITPALCGLAADLVGNPGGALLCAATLSLLAVPFFVLHQRMAGQVARR